jgi:hypothetical protein
MEMAFVRPLKDVTPRLELLGFTLDMSAGVKIGHRTPRERRFAAE